MRNLTYHHLLIFAIGLFYFTMATWVFPQETFFSPDNGIKYMQLKEMLRQGVMNPHLEYPGYKVDNLLMFSPYNASLVVVKGETIYSHFSPLFPWLSSFLYAMYGPSGLYIIPVLSGFLSMIIMYYIARRFYNDRESLFCSILLGLGTPIFFYSINFWEHSFAFFITTTVLLFSLKIIEKKTIFLLFLPLVLLCILIRDESIVFIFSIFLAGSMMIWKERNSHRKILFTICAAILLSLIGFISFNLITSGTFSGIHFAKHFNFNVLYWLLVETVKPDYTKLKTVFAFLFSTGLGQGIQISAILAMAALLIMFPAIVLMRINERFLNNKVINYTLCLSLTALTIAAIVNIYRYSTLIGVFQVTPFIIFSSFIVLEKSKDKFLRFIKLLTLIYFILILFLPFFGQTQWGPRYILYVYPLLIILCWKAIPIIKQKFNKPMCTFLQVFFIIHIFLSFIIQINGVTKLYSRKKQQINVETIFANEPTGVIISAFENTLPTFYSRNYSEKLFFTANNNNIGELINLLYQNNIKKFSVYSLPSYITWEKIDTTEMDDLLISGDEKIHLLKDIYIDDNERNEPVLKVFEIRS